MQVFVCDCAWYSGATSLSAKERKVPYSMLRPTYTHEALQKLVSLGVLKHLISQNTDGLHRLSGIPRDRLSELHGNAFHERCEKCGTKYERPFVACTRGLAVPEHVCVHCHCNHRTGTICERKVSMHLICHCHSTHKLQGFCLLEPDIFRVFSSAVISRIKRPKTIVI